MSFSPLDRSSMVGMSWVSHNLRLRKPCWQLVRMLFFSKLDMTLEWMTCSRIVNSKVDLKSRAFFASEEHKKYDLWSCQKVTDALIYLLDNIYNRFGSKLYRQNVGIPMGTNCAPLLLTCFCSAMRGTS